MKDVIDARVIQKVDTLRGWNDNSIKTYSGEMLIVKSDIDDRIVTFKVGANGKEFKDIPDVDFSVRDKADPNTIWSNQSSGVYVPIISGIYKGIEVNLSDGYQVLYWDKETLSKIVYPANYTGLVFGGIIDDSEDLSNPTNPIWYIAKSGTYNTNPQITIDTESIITWNGLNWSYKPFELEVRGDFLIADNIQELKSMPSYVTELLVNGTYKGVTLLGYYAKGDTPNEINYYISGTDKSDNGGSVLLLNSIKLEHEFKEGFDIRYFGGVDQDGVSNNSALINAIDYMSDSGLPIVIPEDFTLRITLEKGTYLHKFIDKKNINIIGGGVIKDIQTYSTNPVERANFLVFNKCENININLKLEGKMIDVNRPTNSVEGQTFFRFENNCKNINLNIFGKGCKTLVEFFAQYDASDLTKLDIKNENISGVIKAINCRYALHSAWGAKQLNIDLSTDTCGRSYFIIGSDLINLNVDSKNQISTSLIKSYYGRGVTNLNLSHTDIYSTGSSLANELIAIHYGDETPAVMENIKIKLNVSNPTNGWGNTFGIFKYIGGGTTPDTIGRGHVLRNIKISGSMKGRSGTQHLVTNVGQFNSPDTIDIVNFEDLKLTGGVSFNFNTNNIGRNIMFENVISDFNIYSNCETVFKSCESLNFTSSSSQSVRHLYDKCVINAGNSQNYSLNKTFSNTKVPTGIERNSEATIGTLFSNRRSFKHDGSLTSPVTAFKIPYNSQGMYTMRYYLVNDATQSSPLARREVFGIKSFSLFVNTNGTPTILMPIENLVTEKSLGADPSVFSVSFSNNGQSVDVICAGSNYNNPLSRMVLELDVLTSGSNFVDIY